MPAIGLIGRLLTRGGQRPVWSPASLAFAGVITHSFAPQQGWIYPIVWACMTIGAVIQAI